VEENGESRIAKGYTYNYPRPAVTSDCVVFGFDSIDLNILLVKRGIEPFKGEWALPGGFLHMDETSEECAARELQEETGASDLILKQVSTFSTIDRDPRGRVISVAFYALANPYKISKMVIKGGDDASDAKWVSLKEIQDKMKLAFDHNKIVESALRKLRIDLRNQPVAFSLLNKKFTIKQLQSVYEQILGKSFDRGNFHKKMVGIRQDSNDSITVLGEIEPTYSKRQNEILQKRKNLGVVTDTGEVVSGVKHKPAKLYTLNPEKFEEINENEDFYFDF